MRVETYVLYSKKVDDDIIPLYTTHEIEPDEKWKVLAYSIATENMTQYFVRTAYSKLVNPAEIHLGELKSSGEYFVKVKQEIFEKYIDVINLRSRTPLRSLERMMD